MTRGLDEITREVKNLPRQERLALVGLLLELDQHEEEAGAESSWEQEIRARIQAVDDGSAIGIPYDEVMRLAQSRLRG